MGAMDYWSDGYCGVPNKSFPSSFTPPPKLRSALSVLRTDSYAYDGVLNEDTQKVMGVSNV